MIDFIFKSLNHLVLMFWHAAYSSAHCTFLGGLVTAFPQPLGERLGRASFDAELGKLGTLRSIYFCESQFLLLQTA